MQCTDKLNGFIRGGGGVLCRLQTFFVVFFPRQNPIIISVLFVFLICFSSLALLSLSRMMLTYSFKHAHVT